MLSHEVCRVRSSRFLASLTVPHILLRPSLLVAWSRSGRLPTPSCMWDHSDGLHSKSFLHTPPSACVWQVGSPRTVAAHRAAAGGCGGACWLYIRIFRGFKCHATAETMHPPRMADSRPRGGAKALGPSSQAPVRLRQGAPVATLPTRARVGGLARVTRYFEWRWWRQRWRQRGGLC